MMEKIREDAIIEIFEKWKDAVRNCYTNGYDNGETTKYYKELEKLDANMEILIDEEFKIRDEVYNKGDEL